MKNKLFAIIALFTLGMFSTVYAQTVKIGYTSASQILPLMPEFKQKQTELQSYSKILENQMKSKQEEFQAKYKDYMEKANDLPPAVREDKEKELQMLQNSIQEFQQKAQEDLQNKEQQLLEPLYNKVQEAINKVAKENDYLFILNAYDGTGTANLLYAKEGTDVTDMILKSMGIEPPAKEASGN